MDWDTLYPRQITTLPYPSGATFFRRRESRRLLGVLRRRCADDSPKRPALDAAYPELCRAVRADRGEGQAQEEEEEGRGHAGLPANVRSDLREIHVQLTKIFMCLIGESF